jgi:hypothetical protein
MTGGFGVTIEVEQEEDERRASLGAPFRALTAPHPALRATLSPEGRGDVD